MNALNEFYNVVFKKAQATVADGHDIPLTLLILPPDNNTTVIAFASDVSNEQIAAVQRTVAREVPTLLVGECWVVHANSREEVEIMKASGTQCKDHPQRIEVVLFTLITPTQIAAAMCPIERPTPGQEGPTKGSKLIFKELRWSAADNSGLRGQFGSATDGLQTIQ